MVTLLLLKASSYGKCITSWCHLFNYWISLMIRKLLFQGFVYFLERKGKKEVGERDVWEKHWLVASCVPPTGDLAPNPGMCPDWEWNQWPFGLQGGAQPTEPHQPGLVRKFFTSTEFSPYPYLLCLLVLILSWYKKTDYLFFLKTVFLILFHKAIFVF